jgi:hypothetical protein
MEIATHTPGPWLKVGEFTIRGIHPKGGDRKRLVAKAIWDAGTHLEETLANARLIAAARSTKMGQRAYRFGRMICV